MSGIRNQEVQARGISYCKKENGILSIKEIKEILIYKTVSGEPRSIRGLAVREGAPSERAGEGSPHLPRELQSGEQSDEDPRMPPTWNAKTSRGAMPAARAASRSASSARTPSRSPAARNSSTTAGAVRRFASTHSVTAAASHGRRYRREARPGAPAWSGRRGPALASGRIVLQINDPACHYGMTIEPATSSNSARVIGNGP